jgi:hypothetical protein
MAATPAKVPLNRAAIAFWRSRHKDDFAAAVVKFGGALRSEQSHRIPAEHAVRGHQRDLLCSCLSNQQTVEGIPVDRWQSLQFVQVGYMQRQWLDTVFFHLATDVSYAGLGQCELPETGFDQDFPDTHGTQQELISFVEEYCAVLH